MRTERAIEVLKEYIDYRHGALKMPDAVELDKALNKAVEGLEERNLLEQIVRADIKVKQLNYELNQSVQKQDFESASKLKRERDKHSKNYIALYDQWYGDRGNQ